MKTKFTLIIACLLIIISCKKNDVVKSNKPIIHSLEELKKIVLTDTSINNVLLATNRLKILNQKNITQYLLFSDKKVLSRQKIKLDSNNFKNLKTKEDVITATSNAGILDASNVGENIYIQLANIKEFVAHYPEVSKLTNEQIISLFQTAFDAKYSNQPISNNINSSFTTLRVANCLSDFTDRYQGCGNSYTVALFSTWAGVALGGAETAGIDVIWGLYETELAYYNYNDCVGSAGDSYFACTGN